jgi:hypothetical protein
MDFKKPVIALLIAGASFVAVHDSVYISEIRKNNAEIKNIYTGLDLFHPAVMHTRTHGNIIAPYLEAIDDLNESNKQPEEQTWVYKLVA